MYSDGIILSSAKCWIIKRVQLLASMSLYRVFGGGGAISPESSVDVDVNLLAAVAALQPLPVSMG